MIYYNDNITTAFRTWCVENYGEKPKFNVYSDSSYTQTDGSYISISINGGSTTLCTADQITAGQTIGTNIQDGNLKFLMDRYMSDTGGMYYHYSDESRGAHNISFNYDNTWTNITLTADFYIDEIYGI